MSAKTRFAGLLHFIDRRFLPEAMEPDAARRAHLTVVVAFLLAGALPLFAAVSLFVYRLPVIAGIDLIAAVLAVAAPFVMRATKSSGLAAWLVLAITTAAIALAGASVEGVTSPAMTWLVVVPILASTLLGRRGAVQWAVICAALVVGLLVFDAYLPNHELPVAARRASAVWNYVLLFGTVAVFAVLYERLHEREAVALASARAELERAREQATLADRMAALGRLAAGVAHEINNPSTFVAGNVRLARDTVAQVRAGTSPSSELLEVEAALTDALTGAVRITDTVRDLKTLGRAGDETRSSVDPADVLDVSLRIVSHQLRHRCTVEKTLQRVSAVVANESRLGQVFVNLLTNAVDALPERALRDNVVRVSARMRDGLVCIEVADNGVGIAPDAIGRVFDPFYSTKAPGDGSGLGLSICRTLVDQMGGTIELQSTLGKGTTFRVLLPPAQPALSDRALPRPASPSRRLRVLVIDDEPLICSALTRLLGRNHHVETCTSAVEALARGDLLRFDVVLCDLMMPGMTGVDFYERVVKEWPQLEGRIGFLSGGTFTDRIRRHADLFSTRLVDKPFDVEKLDSLLAALAPPASA